MSLTARYHLLLSGSCTLLSDKMKERIKQDINEYLTTFLIRANTNPIIIPKLPGPMKTCCIKWMSEKGVDCRPCVLLTFWALKDKYHEMRDSSTKSKRNKDDLITDILRPVNASLPTHQLNKVKDPTSLKQELTNIVICIMALKPPERDAKDHCQKGHNTEGVYS